MMKNSALKLFPALALLVLTTGCSIRQMAIGGLADAMAASGAVYASDNDPELVGEAIPFALKTIDALLIQSPKNPGLLLAACQGYTQYSYGFIEFDLIRLELEDYRRYKVQHERALNLYLRARDYCLRALDLKVEDGVRRLAKEPEAVALELDQKDMELLFWTASSWGSAIALGVDRTELVVDLPVIRVFFERALELDPDYQDGLLHEAMVVIESLPEAMGGSPERAREHWERALELSKGQRAGTYVNWAELFSWTRQNREEFERLLGKALAVDVDALPEERLNNVLAQQRARVLLRLADDLFI